MFLKTQGKERFVKETGVSLHLVPITKWHEARLCSSVFAV